MLQDAEWSNEKKSNDLMETGTYEKLMEDEGQDIQGNGC